MRQRLYIAMQSVLQQTMPLHVLRNDFRAVGTCFGLCQPRLRAFSLPAEINGYFQGARPNVIFYDSVMTVEA
jgi:hypothetical protein